MNKLPITVGKQIIDDYPDLKQVIIFAWDGRTIHTVTYGATVEDCHVAAEGVKEIQKRWGWPEELQAESASVMRMKMRIEQLEKQLQALRNV